MAERARIMCIDVYRIHMAATTILSFENLVDRCITDCNMVFSFHAIDRLSDEYNN